ncbi:MAG TPA: hypothetical protein VJM46_01485 [Candidatus Saccharimonadales bacterium]|nr:hypothetical protein [Candidatus Saccharimonadales bacterium]
MYSASHLIGFDDYGGPEMSLNYSNILTAIGIGFTIIVGAGWVLPKLSGSSRYYYLFLLAWTVPYMLGQVCQEDKWGSVWVQYHLVDFSYIKSSTAFGAALYVAICWLKKRRTSQTGIFLSMGVLFIISIVVSYVGEIWDTGWSLVTYGWQPSAVDTMDYLVFTAGLIIVATPACIFPRIYSDALVVEF